jgi:hypothetical protein
MKYYMLSSDFLNSEEIQKLDINHRLEGRGAIMFIFEYLIDRRNGLGSYISIPSLARSMGKNKKFLLDIINNYGLFLSPKDSDIFYSPYLRTTLGLPEHPSDEEIQDCAGGWKSSKKVEKSLKKVATFSKKVAKITPQLADNQHAPYIEHKDKDSNREDIDKETTAAAVVKTAAPADFLTMINSVFDDENWMRTIEAQTGINIFSDSDTRKLLVDWFDKKLIASGCNDESGYKPRDAKKYLRNLLLQGRKTRNEFVDLVSRSRERAKRKPLLSPPDERTSGPGEYESVVDGVRYARQKESVPMSAPPQESVYRRWSCIYNEWVPLDKWNFEKEMKARKRTGLPDKLLIQ